MSNTQPLKAGQEVFLKRPLQIYAKVVGACEDDPGLPEGQARYIVQLLPLEQIYLAENLEPAQRPHPTNSSVEEPGPEDAGESTQISEMTHNPSSGEPFFDLAQEINNLIAARAYEIFEARGSAHGRDIEDWLLAVSEILLNLPVQITETETGMTLRAEVPGFTEKELEVRVVPCSVCISGKRRDAPGQTDESAADSLRSPDRIFRVLDLPSEVDPMRVDASAGGGILEIHLVKMGSRKVVPVRAKAASA